MLRTLVVLLAFILGSTTPVTAEHRGANPSEGAVFVATNSPDPIRGNEVVMFARDADGELEVQGRYPTGGGGSGPGTLFSGDALASQGSMAVARNGRFLLVTNFRANDATSEGSVSVFHISREGLVRTDVKPTGGELAVGVAAHRDLVYVLNAGGSGLDAGFFDANLVGFRLSNHGILTQIAASEEDLGSDTPAQANDLPNVLFSASEIRFTPDGRLLAVIIKGTAEAGGLPVDGMIDFFSVGRDGRLGARTSNLSNGLVPFALAFDDRDHVIVVEAIGGPTIAGLITAAVSSYSIGGGGALTLITASQDLDGALDSCWIVRVGSNLYTSNFFSDSVSQLGLASNGEISLIDGAAGQTSARSFNLDMAATPDGRFLYDLLPGVGAVAGFEVEDDGSLTPLGEFAGLDPSPDVDPAPEAFSTDGGSPAGMVAVDFVPRRHGK